MTVTKTVRFDAAHVLTNHQGLCKNLHGHTYRVDVSVAQAPGDSGDMVIDFKDLKSIATAVVCDRFDHAFIYNTGSAGECDIAAVVERHGMRTVALPFRSTAENLARYFFDELKSRIVNLSSVRVWETADSCAECFGADGSRTSCRARETI
jgi:6-pyruvoyltetrahydropterin/6-carboxytetrahydropterin synthase